MSQELRAVEGVADDSVVNSGQCGGHCLCVLSISVRSRVYDNELRSCMDYDVQQLMLGSNRRPVGFWYF